MYRHVFVAGTFDGIHKGHEALLRRAFDEGENVTIGLTPDDFVKKFKKLTIRRYSTRKKELEDWLRDHKFQARIIPIEDPYEPAASMAEIDAIVTSTKTAFRAREINDIRHLRGLSELAVLEVPMTIAEDKKPISSSRMRSGEIDQDGKLILPDNLRPELSRPLGRVLSGQEIKQSIDDHRGAVVITVGDVATETLIRNNVIPSLAIIDQKVGRKSHDTLRHLPKIVLRARISVKSGPGYIAKEATGVIANWSKKPERMLLIIEGEEDLLALPAIVHAPKGSVVYYGQPGEGLVEVVVMQEKKKDVVALLERFAVK